MVQDIKNLVLGFERGDSKIYWTKKLKERITEVNAQNLSEAEVVMILVSNGEVISDLFTDVNGNHAILFKLKDEI